MNITNSQHPAHVTALITLCLSSILPVLPHASRLPLWIPMLYLSLMLWRLSGPLLDWPLPGKKNRWLYLVQVGLSVFGVIGIYIHYGTLFGRDPGIALLVMLLGFKIIETHHEREFYVVICLGFILIVTNFFYSQTILTAFYMSLVVIAQVTALISLNDHNQQLLWKIKLRLSVTILVVSIPMMLVIFFLFPRIDGPLWGMPKDSQTGKTGLDDTMTPGNISQLLQSDEIAFRVKFTDRVPGINELYWRGPVMWHTDGKTWSRQKLPSRRRPALKTVRGKDIHYEITLEPNQRKWLFSLEMPVNPTVGIMTSDFQLLSKRAVHKRMRYELTSYTEYQIIGLGELDRKAALQLPKNYHPKARQLAIGWVQQHSKPREIVEQALNFFNEQNFYYSLLAPALADDAVDQFLFDTKTGFCEHFSSSFVVLMRAAGIPARIVTGYQGANYNPVGDYYNVYQRDAHAWAEVWLEETGWERVDPTAAVSPERILQGIENALPEMSLQTPFDLDHQSLVYQVLKQIHNNWDAFNNLWNQWVISYGAERQKNLMLRMGFDHHDWKALGAALFISIGILLVILAVLIVMRSPADEDPIHTLYVKFCAQLGKHGAVKLAHEGPQDFAKRVSHMHPDWSQAIKDVIKEYVSMRYGMKTPDPIGLRNKMKDFKQRFLTH